MFKKEIIFIITLMFTLLAKYTNPGARVMVRKDIINNLERNVPQNDYETKLPSL